MTNILRLTCCTFFVCINLFAAKKNDFSKTITSGLIAKTQQLSFVENKGQMKDEKGAPTPFVLYKAESKGLNIWITTTGITYQFIKAQEAENKNLDREVAISYEWKRVDMILKNASIKKGNCIAEEEKSLGVSNFYLGHCKDGILNVKSFNKIIIKNIYEGIDWVLYTNTKINSLKQDFIVHPGANPDQIKIIYEGNGRFEALNNQIHFENSIGELQEGKLFCYQENENNEIKSNYLISKNQSITNLGAGNFIKNQDVRAKRQDNSIKISDIQHPSSDIFSYEVAIQLNNYDRTKKLIIDPQLIWATFYGGAASFDGANAISSDSKGDIYITGYLGSFDFPTLDPGNGAYYQALHAGGNFEIFIMKFTNAGVHFWTTYYGGFNQDVAYDICNDNLDNVLITGYSKSTDFPVYDPGAPAYFQGTRADDDVIILKFDSNGVRLWATFYGATLKDQGHGITTDNNNNIYVTGFTSSTNFPLQNQTGSYNQASYGGGTFDSFVLKFSNTGSRLWATYYGGNGSDIGHAINTDNNNNLFLSGETSSSNLTTINPGGGAFFSNTNAGNKDGFICRFDNGGAQTWGTYYGGTLDDIAYDIKTDNVGNVFVAGNTASNNFPVLNPANGAYFKGTISGTNSDDVFISKFNNTGTQQWSTYYGGTSDESYFIFSTIVNLCIDNCDNVYLGFTTKSANITTKTSCSTGYNDNTLDSDADAFITQFSNTGAHLWASYLGGFGTDFRSGMTIDPNNNLFVTGEWTNWLNNINSASYPTTDPGAGAYFDATHNGDDDVAIWKFSPPVINASAISTPSGCPCSGTATAIAIGGCAPYQYLWYDSNWSLVGNVQTMNNLCAGNYQVIVRDSISCSNPDTVSITIAGPTPPNVSMSPNANLSCVQGATAFVYANSTTPNVTYSWSGTGIVSGANNDTAIVNATGTYTVTITNTANGCTITGTVTVINNNNQPNVAGGNNLVLTCLNNSGIITASSSTPGVAYNWSGPGIVSGATNDSAVVNTAGTYTVLVTDPNNGCTNTATVTVSNSTTLPNVSGGNTLTLTCSLISGIITANSSSPGVNYNWSGPGIVSGNTNDTAIVNTTGTYTVTVTDANGCSNTTTVSVVADTISPSVSSESPLVFTCIIYTGVVSANSGTTGATYSWSGPGVVSGGTTNSATVNATGTYTVTVTNPANGCTNTSTVLVSLNTASPNVTPGATLTVTSCIAVSGNISASSNTPGATYSWNGPGIVSGGNTSTPAINALGTYTVIVTDPATGCTATATVLVNSSTTLPVISSSSVSFPCNQANVVVSASSNAANAVYSWQGSGIVSGNNTAAITVNTTGTFTVVVTDPATGCTNSTTVAVVPPVYPVASVSPDLIIQLGENATLTAGGGVNYFWFPSINLNTVSGSAVLASPKQTTTYCVEVTDNNGCRDTACVTITVEIPCPVSENLDVPNAFSPNKDGVNEEFCLQGWDVCLKEFQVIIFNRWGEKVFESKDPNFCWDGNFNKITLDSQVFVYYIRAKFIGLDEPIIKKGNISLIK